MQTSKEFYDRQGRIFASSVVEPKQGLLMDVWGGEIDQDDNINAVMMHCYKQIQTHKLNHWLCDLCNLEGDFSSVLHKALPKLIRILETGQITKFAFISRRSNNAERMQLISVLRQHGVEVQTFATLVNALEWLVVPQLEEDVWDEAEVLTY